MSPLAASSPELPMSKNSGYTLQTQLKGHTGLVLCMSVTEDGKLASGGIDGVRIWDFRSIVGKHVPPAWKAPQLSRPCGAGERGPTTALTWIRREDEPEDGLVYGTASGMIACWREVSGSNRVTAYEETYSARLANPGEITAIAFDSASNRLAVSNRNSVVSLLRVGPKLDLHPIFTVVLKDHVPKALAFSQSGEVRAVHSFGLYDGIIYTLSGRDGKIEDQQQTGCRIGNVSANLRRGVFCLDDPAQGVALYRYSSWDRVRTYAVAIEKSMRPRQISFIEDCKFILSGSDHGAVYLFDRRSGNMVDELRCGTGRVQALTATEHLEKPLIFSAVCRSGWMDDECVISVWQKTQAPTVPAMSVPGVPKVKHAPAQVSFYASLFKLALQACFLVMALGFIWQNLPEEAFDLFDRYFC
ncbi:WD40 repeat-like protein [Agrocybe pediades]|nr:WD40 repeat-like protein [Agrocybe pediades]